MPLYRGTNIMRINAPSCFTRQTAYHVTEKFDPQFSGNKRLHYVDNQDEFIKKLVKRNANFEKVRAFTSKKIDYITVRANRIINSFNALFPSCLNSKCDENNRDDFNQVLTKHLFSNVANMSSTDYNDSASWKLNFRNKLFDLYDSLTGDNDNLKAKKFESSDVLNQINKAVSLISPKEQFQFIRNYNKYCDFRPKLPYDLIDSDFSMLQKINGSIINDLKTRDHETSEDVSYFVFKKLAIDFVLFMNKEPNLCKDEKRLHESIVNRLNEMDNLIEKDVQIMVDDKADLKQDLIHMALLSVDPKQTKALDEYFKLSVERGFFRDKNGSALYKMFMRSIEVHKAMHDIAL